MRGTTINVLFLTYENVPFEHTSQTQWYGGIGSCVDLVKFSMSPNGLFCPSTLQKFDIWLTPR